MLCIAPAVQSIFYWFTVRLKLWISGGLPYIFRNLTVR